MCWCSVLLLLIFVIVVCWCGRLDLHEEGLEVVGGEGGGILDAGLVGVDSVDRVVEQVGYLLVVGDTKAHEGKDTQFGIEQLALLEFDTVLGAE